MKRSGELSRKTPLKAKTPMRRTGPPNRIRSSSLRTTPVRKATSSPNNFPEETRLMIRRRSGGRCEAATRVCTGTAEHFHHRQTRSKKDQRPCNGLHVCRACHNHIHAVDGEGSITKSRMMGWIVPTWADPAEIVVRRGDWGR